MAGIDSDVEAGREVAAEVLNKVVGRVSWITLNRPAVHNAMTGGQRDRVIALLEEASESIGIGAVVIAGTGEGFCSGADLRSGRNGGMVRPAEAPERTMGEVARMIRHGAQRLIGAVLDCEKPVVAAVNGTAAGLGAHLAFACDLVIASEGARFIEVFVRRGIAPDAGGAYLLPRLVGLQRAKEMVFFGDDLTAREAARLGMVNRVVAPEDLEQVAGEWATRLAAGPTKAIGIAKWLLNRSLDSDRATAFEEEAMAQELVTSTADMAEGMSAFAERRKPRFRGW